MPGMLTMLAQTTPRAEWYGPLARTIDRFIGLMAGQTGVLAVVLGFGVGALLAISPVALPTIPAVVSVLTPLEAGEGDTPPRLRPLEAVPVVGAFVLGMDGIVAVAGYLFVELTVALARASVVLHVVAAVLLAVAGLRLLTRRTSLCRRTHTIPPTPGAALVYGIGFALGGCPGCLSISLSVGAAGALLGGPIYALGMLAAFVVGHTVVLLGVATAGARFVRSSEPGSRRWARLDTAVGILFLVAAAYYTFRVLSGTATSILPGELGGLIP